MPLILWIICRFTDINITLMDALCIYGYALFIYIPVSVTEPLLPL
jgi:hypothetical protein